MECHSEKAKIFMCSVYEEIVKAEGTSRKKSQRRECHIPEEGRESIRKLATKGLPMDFYDPDWLDHQTSGQKRETADIHTIVFLPEASKSLLVNQTLMEG
ncbi:hypothetical protein O181_085818 [Austropuccinia psidii MF-1]|uniref:Uncharacterized protein n=1 Tax=Austropuccinia psidii MF-1 TaxID=1389203 RepID=A0A9Q3FY93_9BASI|nr:hypothetical protein [Austropuccinia psidii MF-1]